jgi:hypothetical protein
MTSYDVASNAWRALDAGQYSTQIFSMAVLLSSLFCYNQFGGIDEAALDRLSLVTEMTKHIRARSEESGDAAELGQGLTLVHFSAQPEPFLTLKPPKRLDTLPPPPNIPREHPLNTPCPTKSANVELKGG